MKDLWPVDGIPGTKVLDNYTPTRWPGRRRFTRFSRLRLMFDVEIALDPFQAVP